jgi:formamidopyrimidine-DNA glycosylase
MPEFPDIVIYLEALEKRIKDRTLERIDIVSPFLLRTAVPPISLVQGKRVVDLRRLGKRICIGLEDDLWLVLHLMIAGRLHWKDCAGAASGARSKGAKGAKPAKRSKRDLATFQFDNGILSLTEAGTQRRASLHLVEGEAGLRNLDPGGLEIFATYQKPDRQGGLPNNDQNPGVDLKTFAAVLKSENHTLKRALTDPHLFSGIGNAYSDEIFFEAQISPIKLTHRLTDEEIERLYLATRATLKDWVARLRTETGDQFPEKVTAKRWRCTAATANLARVVERRFSVSVTPVTRRTIAPPARPAASYWLTAPCRAFCGKIGRRLRRNSVEATVSAKEII